MLIPNAKFRWAHPLVRPELGCLIVANENLFTQQQQYFYRAVILVIQHDQDGTVGLILNRPTTFAMGDLCTGSLQRVPGMEDNVSVCLLRGPCTCVSMQILLRCTCLSVYPSIHSPTHPPTHPPIHLPTHPPTHPPIHLPTHPPTHSPTFKMRDLYKGSLQRIPGMKENLSACLV